MTTGDTHLDNLTKMLERHGFDDYFVAYDDETGEINICKESKDNVIFSGTILECETHIKSSDYLECKCEKRVRAKIEPLRPKPRRDNRGDAKTAPDPEWTPKEWMDEHCRKCPIRDRCAGRG